MTISQAAVRPRRSGKTAPPPGDMKERIKKAATDLLIRNGYRGTSFADIAKPLGITTANIHYHFGTKQKLVEQAVRDYVAGSLAGHKQVWLDLFEGSARRTAGPLGAKDQNPLLLVFLQMDVTEMSRLTAGSAFYFQQQIRRHFNDMAPTEKVQVQFDGRPVQATRITLRPFAADPQIVRLLPPLTLVEEHVDQLVAALREIG